MGYTCVHLVYTKTWGTAAVTDCHIPSWTHWPFSFPTSGNDITHKGD